MRAPARRSSNSRAAPPNCGYKGVISDAGVGVLSACAALRSAALNVHINVPSLHDRVLAERCRAEIDALTAAGARDSESVYATVRARL